MATVLVAAAAGCSSPGRLVAHHDAGVTAATVGAAPVDGDYGLFVAGEANPLIRYPLVVGQPLGFEVQTDRDKDDLRITWLIAVAGGERRRLDLSHTYEWRRQ